MSTLTCRSTLDEAAVCQFIFPGCQTVRPLSREVWEAELPNRLSCRLRSAAAIEQIGCATGETVLQVHLPAGEAEIELRLTSRPVFPLADTVVFCRPEQTREAAVVLSCLPHEKFTPLIPFASAPMRAADYCTLYREFRTAEREQNAAVGTRTALHATIQGGEQTLRSAARANERRTALLRRLTPYRSWLRQRLQLAEFLSDVPFRRAVFLFWPTPEDTQVLSDPFLERWGQWESDWSVSGSAYTTVLNPEWEGWYCVPDMCVDEAHAGRAHRVLAYRDLPHLTQLAVDSLWSNCTPPEVLEAPVSSEGHVLLGLFRALRERRPLRLVNDATATLEMTCRDVNERIETDEVVLIEEGGDAGAVLGVLYAHERRARCVVTPRPHLDAMQRALTQLGEKLSGTAQSGYLSAHRDRGLQLRELSDQQRKFVEELPQLKGRELAGIIRRFDPRRFLSDLNGLLRGWRTALQQVEREVTRQVPQFATDLVGDRRLTALSAGIPYSFFRRESVAWEHKPIGHVFFDPVMLLLNEFHARGCERAAVTFNLILDTNPFETGEAAQLCENLADHPAYTLVLDRGTGSLQSLIFLGPMLDWELVYFNTHGSEDAIQLDVSIPMGLGSGSSGESTQFKANTAGYKIEQWVELPSHPLVFNNSCLSWTGVGPGLVRSGARGYVGSLWSVDKDDAAAFARVVGERIARSALPVAEALTNTAVDPYTARAYVCIGTCNTRLLGGIDPAWKAHPAHLATVQTWLLDMTRRMDNNPRFRPLRNRLYAEALKVRQQRERLYADDLAQLRALVFELDVLENCWGGLDVAPDYAEVLIQRCEALLGSLELPREMLLEERAKLAFAVARVLIRRGRVLPASDKLRESIEFDGERGAPPVDALLLLGDLYCQQRRFEDARSCAQRARALSLTDGREYSALSALGQLGQIARKLGDLATAESCAREGADRAARLGFLKKRLQFQQDLVSCCLVARDYQAALRLGCEALVAARDSLVESYEMAALGALTLACYGHGDFAEGIQYARQGLLLAETLADVRQQGAFLLDLGQGWLALGNVEAARGCLRDAEGRASRVGQDLMANQARVLLAQCDLPGNW